MSVVIFEVISDQAWICVCASPLHFGPAKISGRLLQSFSARVLTFFNRFLEMHLPGEAVLHTSGLLRPRADLQKCEKLMVKRYFLQRGV